MNITSKKILNAAKWSFITEFGSKLVSPVVNLVLARVFTPEIFGIIATLTMVVSFADIFSDAGFQKYLVQHEFSNEDELNKSATVAFWANFSVSLCIYTAIFVFSTPICRLVGNEGVERLLRVSALNILLTSFSSIQQAIYKRNFDFDKLCKIRIIGSVLPLVVTIPMALILKNCWAYVIGQLALQLYNAIALTYFSRWKPTIFFSRFLLEKMLSFSLWTLLESISIWMSLNIGTFIVGTVLNDYWLGIYKISMSTVNSYMNLLTAATTPVLFSALSRIQDEDSKFKDVLFKFQRNVAIIVLPIGVGFAIYSSLATQILLGKQWKEASEYLGIWGIMYGLKIIYSNFNSEVFRSKGKPKLSLIVQVSYLGILIPGLLLCIHRDFRSLFYFRALSILFQILISSIMLKKLTGISLYMMLRNTSPAIIASSAIIGVGLFVRLNRVGFGGQLFSVLICIIVYFLIIMLFPTIKKDVFAVVEPYIKKGKSI